MNDNNNVNNNVDNDSNSNSNNSNDSNSNDSKIVPEDIKTITQKINENYNIAKMYINQNGLLLQYVIEQTDELCMDAIRNNNLALKYIKNPSLKMCMFALLNGNRCNIIKILCKQDENIIYEILRKKPDEIKSVTNQTKMMATLVLSKNGLLLEFIHNQILDEELCNIAVQNNGLAIRFVPEKFRSEYSNILAVKQNPESIKYINNRTTELWTVALKNNGLVIKYLDDNDFKTYNLNHNKKTEILLILAQIAVSQNKGALQEIFKNKIFRSLAKQQKTIGFLVKDYITKNKIIMDDDNNLFDLIINKLREYLGSKEISNVFNTFRENWESLPPLLVPGYYIYKIDSGKQLVGLDKYYIIRVNSRRGTLIRENNLYKYKTNNIVKLWSIKILYL